MSRLRGLPLLLISVIRPPRRVWEFTTTGRGARSRRTTCWTTPYWP